MQIPELCYVLIERDGQATACIVKAQQLGYYEPGYRGPWTQQIVDDLNANLGVLPEEASAMKVCSMFDCWSNYSKTLKSINCVRSNPVYRPQQSCWSVVE